MGSELSVSLTTVHTVISLFFLVTVGVYALFSFILYYHWNEYSVDHTVSKVTGIAYLLTTIPLLVVMGIMTLIV